MTGGYGDTDTFGYYGSCPRLDMVIDILVSSSRARYHVDEVFGGGGLGGREGGPLHLGPLNVAAAVVAVPVSNYASQCQKATGIQSTRIMVHIGH